MDPNKLLDLVKRYEENRDFITNEETVKMVLVAPFVQLLGYDTTNPREVRLEFCADFAQCDGKRYADRMDFAIFDRSGTKPLLAIETKPLGTDLRARCQQLARYLAQMPDLHFGIMTDGCRYLFYGDLERPNSMDAEPFFEFSLDDPKTDWTKIAKFLGKFSRDSFNADTLITDAENARYRQAMIDRLVAALRAPAEDEGFLKWLTAGVYQGVRTAAVMTRLGDVARDCIEPTLLRVMSNDFIDKLRQRMAVLSQEEEAAQRAAQAGQAGAEEPLTDGAAADVEAGERRKAVAETTEEELRFFSLVRDVCEKHGAHVEEIVYRDTVNYLNVSYQRPTNWFVRFFSRGAKTIVSQIPVEEAKRLVSAFKVEEAPAVFGVSRVYIDDVSQVWALKDYLTRALDIVRGGSASSGGPTVAAPASHDDADSN